MKEFSRLLGDSVKKARKELGLTQIQVADQVNADVRTIMNIENYKGNPKMEILFPLIRVLKIDPREIFNPEQYQDSPTTQKLFFLIDEGEDQEIDLLIPVIKAVLAALRSKK